MSGLASSLNLSSPPWVENTFYVDTRYGTASPPAMGERFDRAFVSGNDAVAAAIAHIQNTPERRAVVWFRPGHHIVYQSGHYVNGGVLILHADPGAVITIVRDDDVAPSGQSFVTWDFNTADGDAMISGEGIWRWGDTNEQGATNYAAYLNAFQVLGRNTASILNEGQLNIISFEAEEFHTAPLWADGIASFFEIQGVNWEDVKILIKTKRLTYKHSFDLSAFVKIISNGVVNVQILSDYTELDGGALVYYQGNEFANITYRCPEHYGINLAGDGNEVNLRLIGGTSLHTQFPINLYGFTVGNCSISPFAGQSHVHCGNWPPHFGIYREYTNTATSYGFAAGEIVFTGFTPNFPQAWRNTLCWGESRACVEFDFSAYPIIGPTTVLSGFGLEGQTLRGFDVRVLSQLTPGILLSFGTSLSPAITAPVNTTTLNAQIFTPTPINVGGAAYDITSNFEQFAITKLSGPNLTQGKIQLYPRLGGALKT